MQKQSRWFYLRYLVLFVLGSLACGLPSFSSPTPTPPPEPPAGTLNYHVTQYTRNLNPGDTVPGAGLQYVGPFGDAHQVSINGQMAVRQISESLPWNGIISQGVFADYQLRLSTRHGLLQSQLIATGPVEIYVFNPEPQALPTLEGLLPPNHIYFTNIAVRYGPISPGGRIPGTTLIFEEVSSQGVRLSGTTDYPYWAVGDAVQWQGQLRPNVFIRLRMPISQANERGLSLSGEAELMIVPPT